MIVPIRHTTPRHSLEVIFDLIPLDIQGTYEALASLTRQELALTQTWIGTNPKCSTYIGHRRYWYDKRNEMLGYSVRLSDREKGILTNKNYTVDTKSMNTKTAPTPTQINIYTDGSQTPFHVGAGYTIQLMGTEIHSNSIKLSENTTVFQAEIIAIREATRKMLSTLDNKH